MGFEGNNLNSVEKQNNENIGIELKAISTEVETTNLFNYYTKEASKNELEIFINGGVSEGYNGGIHSSFKNLSSEHQDAIQYKYSELIKEEERNTFNYYAKKANKSELKMFINGGVSEGYNGGIHPYFTDLSSEAQDAIQHKYKNI